MMKRIENINNHQIRNPRHQICNKDSNNKKEQRASTSIAKEKKNEKIQMYETMSNSIGIGKPKWILIGQTNSKHLIATFPSICLTQSKHCRRFKKHGAPRVTL